MKAMSRRGRMLADLGETAAPGVLQLIRLLEERYGASEYLDSGHNPARRAPVLIIRLPLYEDAEVGVPLNKRDISLYVRDRTCVGKRLREVVSADKVAKVYPRDGKPTSSVYQSPYLRPSASNEVLMLKLEPDDLEPVLAAFFGDSGKALAAPASGVAAGAGASIEPPMGNRPPLTEEEFAALLERQSEIGRAGEGLVILDEQARLRRCGCPKPEDYVLRIAESDVGRGYDVASTWPGEERCIEVKTTTRAGSDFFLTANERAVLGELGERAWIYRVEADGNHDGKIVARLNNPMCKIAEAQMTPVVWRVPNSVFDDEG
ncbi:MAG: DUF3883 domain-containing protein [Burkholderiaceae bacterium]|nr:MAG: DUF3883 domain-containing protein [Burkholderiaceae bacterium]